jgi:hypothetical protein
VTQRRIRLAGAVLAAALVTAAVLIPTLLNGGSSNVGPSPSHPAPSAPEPTGLSAGCPPVRTPPRFPDHATLPTGATAVRLCNGDGDSCACGPNGERIDTGFQEPADLLTTGTEDLVDLVNRSEGPPDDEPVFCAGVGGSTHVFWFLYPNGDARAVTYLSGACLDLTVGPGEVRYGGEELHAAFSQHLISQRATMSAPGETRVPDCNPNVPPYSGLLFSDVELVTAIYCPLDDQGRWQRAVLTPTDVDMLNQDYNVDDVELPRSCPDPPRTAKIVGYTAWGDLLELTGNCNVYFGPGSYYDNGIIRGWKPSEAFLNALDALELGDPQPQQGYPDTIE